ncbi:leucine-rich repeat domain-containing protein [Streptosporangium sp. NPDC051022]|uniref:leucine-rich repeat domain-containing protein n=1 Tax=Streptosporangium sp. NPDC051022 TaxID=3155752 RepID=UPI00341B52E4
MGNLIALTELNLSENYLSAVPDPLRNLIALTRLNLSMLGVQAPEFFPTLELTTLPEWLGNLTNLPELHLVGNQLPPARNTGRPHRPHRTRIAGNRLTALPETLGDLVRLTHLGLANNRLTTVPESLGGLPALTWVDLYGNPLVALPEWRREIHLRTGIDADDR